MAKYDPKKIERKWQKYWEKKKISAAREKDPRPKYYSLETFPYPSAAGLHVGHPKGYTAEDILARYRRLRGFKVLYTMGWDAFGLPTENYAIKMGKNPAEVAAANIKNFKRQVKMFGFSYDWSREINTSNPSYYKWTQWIFLQLFKNGLAYRARAPVNWCPNCRTVLANEQVIEGKCERCGSQVIQREMEQWFFKITDAKHSFPERLLKGLAGLDWPEDTKIRQRNWIGKSEGAEIEFRIQDFGFRIRVFTTRPDTLYGATYLVLSPENPLIEHLRPQIKNWNEAEAYRRKAKEKTELQRTVLAKEKTGVELKGIKAINPGTKERIPIWVSDYVLITYGTGAIMAVPAHDERDWEFAKKFNLPIRSVITREQSDRSNPIGIAAPPAAASNDNNGAYTGEGILINSGQFNDLSSAEAKKKITESVGGRLVTRYRLRDWLISRQRYWGAPIPIIECETCGPQPVPDKDLPVLLPKDVDFRPTGEPPLARSKSFHKVNCPKCQGPARRSSETMDTFVDSSWYYLRYTDPKNRKEFASKAKLRHWLPVDLYIIGAEHTVLHLLYSRFIAKFLFDLGYLNFEEPFLKLRHIGLILGADGQKMSKSRGNVVNPDEVVSQFGADTVRLYEMFMGPLGDAAPWNTRSIVGVRRFLEKVWVLQEGVTSDHLLHKITKRDPELDRLERLLHKTIKKVTTDIETFNYNTAISALMILVNEFSAAPTISKGQFETLILLLSPFAPHLAEEFWQKSGHKKTLAFAKWPEFDERLLREEEVIIMVQINGKIRDKVVMPAESSEETVKEKVLALPNVQKYLQGKEPKKFIYIKNRLVNIVT